MGYQGRLSYFVLALFLSNLGLAVDLDYKSAKDRYDRQARIAELAKQRFDTQAQLLSEANAQVNSAIQAEQRAKSELQSQQQKLVDYDNRIVQIERDISSIQSEIASNRTRLSQIERDLSPLYPKKANAEQKIPDLRRQIDHVSQRISQLESQDPNSAELPQLRQRKQRLEQDLNQAQNDLNSIANEIERLERNRNSVENEISSDERRLRDRQIDLSSTQRERDRQLIAIQDARDELRRAEMKTEDARRRVDSIRPSYLAAQAESQRETQLAQEAYAYYQQVVANYNAALNAVYAKADAAAGQHGSQEAAERAPEKGKSDGLVVGQTKGREKGERDGMARELARGYKIGRDNAASDPGLLGDYTRGIEAGKAASNAKGKAEDFPLGYNEALKAHFASVPPSSETLDISENISSDPGGSGNVLNLTEKAVGSVSNPVFSFLTEPNYSAPAYETPGVSVPSVLNAYYNPPCAALVLPEFEPLCKQRYDASYRASFDANYQAVYRQNFRPSFEEKAKAIYDATLAQTYSSSLAQGKSRGAEEQGVLDGFDQSLGAAKQAQYAAGKTALSGELKTGGFLVFREASLSETSGDGLFTPGEAIKLKLVVDNYGLEATRLSKVRVRLTGVAGLGAASFVLRELPSLKGYTRTTLMGVSTLPAVTEFPGEKLALSGALEIETAGGWQTVASLNASAETRFPLELSDVVIAAPPKVDEVVKGTFRFTNNLRTEVELGKMSLKSSPEFVLFPTTKTGEVSKIQPGETKDIVLDIKPGAWVGENTYVKFVSDTELSDTQKYSQAFAKYIHMNRSASLNLYDSQGKAIPSSMMTVKEGSRVVVQTGIVFHAKAFLPGPFQLRVGKSSNPKITSTSNTTVAVNYGGLSPQTQLDRRNFYFDVPKGTAGKTEYVMLTLSEGATYRHILMVYLNIVP